MAKRAPAGSAKQNGRPRDIVIGGVKVAPDSRATIDLPVANLYTHTPLTMPVQVVRGRTCGPVLFVSAALHGDEINGVEIIRRLLKVPALRRLRGTLIAVPIVNVHGFLSQSRYLPDRRDLNRSFPGSEGGSVAARLAYTFATEIVGNADYGIDLHTGAIHRPNLPQIRARLDDAETLRLAEAFRAPVILNADTRPDSLREYATEQGIPVLLYESGEALRFDESCIRVGLRGVMGIMRALGMLSKSRRRSQRFEPVVAQSSSWVRAPTSGILRALAALGERVSKAQALGVVSDPFGEAETEVIAPNSGIVIGRVNLPLVNEGDALFHVARFESLGEAARRVETFRTETEHWQAPSEEPPIV
jgi:predicted deacylase